jgi:hypothetical protein
MNSLERFRKLLSLFVLIFLLWACSENRIQKANYNTGKPVEAKSVLKSEKKIRYVDELVGKVQSLKGQIVTVRGQFMGWQGSCKGPPPETRSDWMLEHEGACIYVSGPTPAGIDRTPNSKDIGREIEIVGRVLLDRGGMPYIKIAHR